ncbi:uncharacterized protein LOC122244381, partial [Penaeus japonicus]|uniref:uncharacterized protein LOC122244381 n=1 Tax=Penaeus japonicus TaxID=27405 RepID=UPI001C7124C0
FGDGFSAGRELTHLLVCGHDTAHVLTVVSRYKLEVMVTSSSLAWLSWVNAGSPKMEVHPSLILIAILFVCHVYAGIHRDVNNFDIGKGTVPDIDHRVSMPVFSTKTQTKYGFLKKLRNNIHSSVLPVALRHTMPITTNALLQIMGRYLKNCLTVVSPEDGLDIATFLQKIGQEGFSTMVFMPHVSENNESLAAGISSVDGCVAQVLFLKENIDFEDVNAGTSSSWNILSITTSFVVILATRPLPDRTISSVLLDPIIPRSAEAFLLVPATHSAGDHVAVYRRCLHCAAGVAGVRRMNQWPSQGKTSIRDINSADDRFNDFHGHVFSVVTMDFPPFIDYTRFESSPGGIVEPRDSMDVRILKEAAREFNFSFVMREPEDGQWGYLLDNNSWTGTVGTVQRGGAAFSMMLSITLERTDVVAFTRAYYVEPMTFVTRKPGPLPQWQAPIKPFRWSVWVLVLVVVLFSGPGLLIIYRLTPYPTSPVETVQKNKQEVNPKSRNDIDSGVIILYMLAPIFGEPVPLFPRVQMCGRLMYPTRARIVTSERNALGRLLKRRSLTGVNILSGDPAEGVHLLASISILSKLSIYPDLVNCLIILVLQNKAMRIIFGCLMTAEVLVMRKKVDLSTMHSRVTQTGTVLGIRILEVLPRSLISQALTKKINYSQTLELVSYLTFYYFCYRSSSARVFCALWWFFCILTTTLYRGGLIARLTVPEMSQTLNTLEQLASSDLQWGMLDTYGSGYQLFRASKVPVYQNLFKSMEYDGMENSMEKVLKGNYAFISWKTYFRNLIARDYTERNGETQVHIAREDFFPGGFGWAFPKSSPYRMKFDQLFQRLIEAGLIDKWMSELIQLSASKKGDGIGNANGVHQERNGPQAFTVYHLQGVVTGSSCSNGRFHF